MLILAIDPGPTHSGVVYWDGSRVWHSEAAKPNESFFGDMHAFQAQDGDGTWVAARRIVFEKVESFGMSVGESVFETVFQTGRIYEYARRCGRKKSDLDRIGRREVKLHICGSAKAKDANIRQALIDRFGVPGTAKSRGPLFGVTSHAWAALALAVTYYDTRIKA